MDNEETFLKEAMIKICMKRPFDIMNHEENAKLNHEIPAHFLE